MLRWDRPERLELSPGGGNARARRDGLPENRSLGQRQTAVRGVPRRVGGEMTACEREPHRQDAPHQMTREGGVLRYVLTKQGKSEIHRLLCPRKTEIRASSTTFRASQSAD